ncbi:MAG: AbrB/MazE/SpoVT family DNA-binding domain-containing protein [Candidatus Limnocylindrales bacterium]
MVSTRVGPGGRVLIPVELRRALKLAEGTILVARVEEDRLILERPAALLERAKARFAAVPDGVSLSDELLADRRTEGRRERS